MALVVVFAVVGWVVAGMPREWNVPEQLAFMVDGGVSATPEFMAILIGLTIYTAAFIAEVVRAGVLSVPRSLMEAAETLGSGPQSRVDKTLWCTHSGGTVDIRVQRNALAYHRPGQRWGCWCAWDAAIEQTGQCLVHGTDH